MPPSQIPCPFRDQNSSLRWQRLSHKCDRMLCKRGSSAGEVTITGADGNGWDLRSDTVIDQHIGHQVTVTGTASHETKAEEKKEGQVENAPSKEAFWQSELFRA
jgi:hypothetical protein